jgi:hypothetical protein
VKLTTSNGSKVFSTRRIDFNVSLTNVMFVSLQSDITVFLIDETDQSFSIPTSGRRETKSNSSSVTRKEKENGF